MQKDINKQHAEIAVRIRKAKRAMFKNHREGTDLRVAANGFLNRLCNEFLVIVPDTSDVVPTKEEELPAVEAHHDWVRLSEAINLIVTSDAMPTKLYNSTIDFLSSNSGELWGKLMVQPNMIVKILVEAAIKEEAKEELAGDAQ